MIFTKSNISKSHLDWSHGVVLPSVLLIGFHMWEMFLVQLTGIGFSISTVSALVIKFGIDLSILYVLIIVVGRIRYVSIGKFLGERLPHLNEIIKWSVVSFILSIYDFSESIKYAIYFQYSFVPYFILEAIVLGVLAPFIEEILFRGICFASLRKGGRFWAYSISTFLFWVYHIKFIQLFTDGSLGIDALHTCIILIFGLVAAYIYDITDKILLCIIFHGIGNIWVICAPIAGYLLGLYQ